MYAAGKPTFEAIALTQGSSGQGGSSKNLYAVAAKEVNSQYRSQNVSNVAAATDTQNPPVLDHISA